MRFSVFAFALVAAGACLALRAEDKALRVEEKLRAVIIDGHNNHNWKATTPLLRKALEGSGRFTVEVATAPADKAKLAEFNVDFAKFQVVVSNYNGPLWAPAMREGLTAFVKGGGGLVVVHAANNSFPDWPEYNEMIGLGGWGGRSEKSGPYIRLRDGKFVRDETPGRGGSHGRQHPFTMISRAPDHPIMKGLPAEWLHAQDELYDRLRGPALNLEVLATALADPATGGTGEHEPLLLTVGYGQGRVFHTALGHAEPAMKCVGFQTTLARGAEWAATGQVTLPAPDDFPTADKTSSRE